MSEKCNKLLTTIPPSREALHTFVCKRLKVLARCRAKVGRSGSKTRQNGSILAKACACGAGGGT